MPKYIDLTGKTFGLWTVEGIAHRKHGQIHWWCVCACKKRRAIAGYCLRQGRSLSCGCGSPGGRAPTNYLHGMSAHPVYRVWQQIAQRCTNPNHDLYSINGGLGIRRCARWDNFAAFWDDMAWSWQKGLYLVRIDLDADYAPDNCLWLPSNLFRRRGTVRPAIRRRAASSEAPQPPR